MPTPDCVSVPVRKGCSLVFPERAYLAGLKLGRLLRRREAEAKPAGEEKTFSRQAEGA